jgi:DNA replication licensing factor MCM5
MRLTDQVAIHEAMEQQTISIAKAGLCTVLNARTSVLAAANPIFGSYDENRGAEQNIQFHATILSRFDAIFLIKDRRNDAQDKVIATHVLDLHITRHTPHQDRDTIPIDTLKRYIAYARAHCHPRLQEEAAEELQNQYVMIRDAVRQRSVDGAAAPIPITVRQLEAIVRISEALAKQELSPVATKAHVQEAIRLFNVSTLDAASSGIASAENLPAELMQEIVSAENQLKRRLAIASKMSERRLVEDLQNTSNISPDATRRAIQILVQRGEFEFRAQRKHVFRRR